MTHDHQRKEESGFRPKRRWNDVIRDDSDKMSVDLYTPRLVWCTANDSGQVSERAAGKRLRDITKAISQIKVNKVNIKYVHQNNAIPRQGNW